MMLSMRCCMSESKEFSQACSRAGITSCPIDMSLPLICSKILSSGSSSKLINASISFFVMATNASTNLNNRAGDLPGISMTFEQENVGDDRSALTDQEGE